MKGMLFEKADWFELMTYERGRFSLRVTTGLAVLSEANTPIR